MNAWLGRLALVLNLHHNNVSLCSLSTNGGELLLFWRGAAAERKHNIVVVRTDYSSSYLFFATGEVSGPLYATLGIQLCILYIAAGMKLPREATVSEAESSPARYVSVCREFVQHAGRTWRGENCIRYYSHPRHCFGK